MVHWRGKDWACEKDREDDCEGNIGWNQKYVDSNTENAWKIQKEDFYEGSLCTTSQVECFFSVCMREFLFPAVWAAQWEISDLSLKAGLCLWEGSGSIDLSLFPSCLSFTFTCATRLPALPQHSLSFEAQIYREVAFNSLHTWSVENLKWLLSWMYGCVSQDTHCLFFSVKNSRGAWITIKRWYYRIRYASHIIGDFKKWHSNQLSNRHITSLKDHVWSRAFILSRILGLLMYPICVQGLCGVGQPKLFSVQHSGW